MWTDLIISTKMWTDLTINVKMYQSFCKETKKAVIDSNFEYFPLLDLLPEQLHNREIN